MTTSYITHFILRYYNVIVESLIFVIMLAGFEYVMFYYILGPEHKHDFETSIPRQIFDNISREQHQHTLRTYLASNYIVATLARQISPSVPSDTNFILSYIPGYYNYFITIDNFNHNVNDYREAFYLAMVVLYICGVIAFMLFCKYRLGATLNVGRMIVGLVITYFFIILFLLNFIYKIVPTMQMVNPALIKKVVSSFFLGIPLQL